MTEPQFLPPVTVEGAARTLDAKMMRAQVENRIVECLEVEGIESRKS